MSGEHTMESNYTMPHILCSSAPLEVVKGVWLKQLGTRKRPLYLTSRVLPRLPITRIACLVVDSYSSPNIALD